MDQPGLQLIEKLGPQIFKIWEEMRRQHPEYDDLVALVECRAEVDDQFAVTIGVRTDFIKYLQALGVWQDGTSWETLSKPAPDLDGLPRGSAIWVVVRLPERAAAILRLVNPPLTSQGGSA